MFGNRLTIVPRVNLVANIGFGDGATHTTAGADPRLLPKSKRIEFPLQHPRALIPSHSLDRQYQQLYFAPLIRRTAGMLGRIIARITRAQG
jgi:hypothetical protein